MPIGRTEYLVFILVCPGSKSSPELEREEEACWGHVAACRANSRTVSSRLDPRRAGYLPIEPGIARCARTEHILAEGIEPSIDLGLPATLEILESHKMLSAPLVIRRQE